MARKIQDPIHQKKKPLKIKKSLTTDIKLRIANQIPININTTDIKWYDTNNT